MNTLINLIENNKESLTSQEYIDVYNELKKINNTSTTSVNNNNYCNNCNTYHQPHRQSHRQPDYIVNPNINNVSGFKIVYRRNTVRAHS